MHYQILLIDTSLSPILENTYFVFEVRLLQVKHYIAIFLLLSVNLSGYLVHKNVLGFCRFTFV